MKDEKQKKNARTRLQISEKSVMQQRICFPVPESVVYGSKSKQIRIAHSITKTCLFKYTEKFTTKK